MPKCAATGARFTCGKTGRAIVPPRLSTATSPPIATERQMEIAKAALGGVAAIATFSLAVANAQPSNLSPADAGGTNARAILPSITVTGKTSLTSPSAGQAAEQKKQLPGGFTIKTTEEMNKGRASNFLDLLQNTPGLFMQSENGVEMSKVSIRGSGIESDDEPLGVEFLLDGVSFDQGDGETIIEDFDVDTLKYAEIYRGADAFKYGALTIGGAINLVPLTGYDADPFQIRLEGGSYGFMRGQISSGGVDGNFDYYVSLSGRYRDGYRRKHLTPFACCHSVQWPSRHRCESSSSSAGAMAGIDFID